MYCNSALLVVFFPLNIRNFVNEHEFCKHLNKSELCGIKSQYKLAINSLKGLPVFQKVCLWHFCHFDNLYG